LEGIPVQGRFAGKAANEVATIFITTTFNATIADPNYDDPGYADPRTADLTGPAFANCAKVDDCLYTWLRVHCKHNSQEGTYGAST
jgi:hypothetical protein